MSFGVQPEGFVKPTFQEIREALVSEAQNLYGPINLGPESAIGQELTIRAEREALLWEALEAVYLSQYPNSASGLSLDNVASFVGLSRLPATRTIVEVNFFGDPNTVIPAGSQASTEAGDVFETVAEVVLDSTGESDGQMRALETGPVLALAGTLTEIETPISGWDTVTNPTDGIVGREIESDPALRERRARSLSLLGSGTLESIRARLIQEIDDVAGVSIFENRSSSIDSDGRPPHSFETIVEGGIDQEIGDLLWRLKPAGIETFGNVSVTVEDSQGELQNVNFSRPEQIFIWVKMTLFGAVDPDLESQIKTDFVEYGRSIFGVGDNIIKQRLFTVLYDNLTALESAEIKIAASLDAGIEPPAGDFESENIQVSIRQISQWLEARVEVTFD